MLAYFDIRIEKIIESENEITWIITLIFQLGSSFIGIIEAVNRVLDGIMVIIKRRPTGRRAAAVIVCFAPEAASAFTNLSAVGAIVIHSTEETLSALTGFVATGIIVIVATPEILVSFSNPTFVPFAS